MIKRHNFMGVPLLFSLLFFSRRHKPAPQSSQDRSDPTRKKKRGAPKGHLGWYRRKPDHIDKTVIVPAPEVCLHCACTDLTPVDNMKDHLQEDIVLQPRTHVTNFKPADGDAQKARAPQQHVRSHWMAGIAISGRMG